MFLCVQFEEESIYLEKQYETASLAANTAQTAKLQTQVGVASITVTFKLHPLFAD